MPSMPMPPEENELESENDSENSGEDLSEMIASVSKNLMTMQGLLADEGVPPELTDRLGQLNEDYKSLLQEIQKKMGAGAPASPGGMVDGNAGMGGRPLPP